MTSLLMSGSYGTAFTWPSSAQLPSSAPLPAFDCFCENEGLSIRPSIVQSYFMRRLLKLLDACVSLLQCFLPLSPPLLPSIHFYHQGCPICVMQHHIILTKLLLELPLLWIKICVIFLVIYYSLFTQLRRQAKCIQVTFHCKIFRNCSEQTLRQRFKHSYLFFQVTIWMSNYQIN